MSQKYLPHINDLPSKVYYTFSEIKSFLHFHQPTLKANLSAILHNLSYNFAIPVIPDPSLTIT